MSWTVPPSAIPIPSNAFPVVLNAANDASGDAAITADEVDFNVLVAPSSGSYVLAARKPVSNLDPVLGLFDNLGQLLAYNDDSGGTQDSQLTANLLAGRRYFIGITNYTGSPNGGYTWSINGPDDDSFENNDTFAAARGLGSLPGSEIGYTSLQVRDDDWYSFTTSASGLSTDFVRINFLHAQGDVDMALYNSAGTFLASSAGETDVESISLAGQPAGTYYVRVHGYAGASNPNYSMTIEPPDDRFENNDTFGTARGLGSIRAPEALSGLRLADEDWYSFTTTVSGTGGDVRLGFLHAQGDVDVALYDSAGTFLASSTGETDVESISLAGRPAGTYYVRVYGYAGTSNPNYSLTIFPPTAETGNRELFINFDGASLPRADLVRYAGNDWSGMVNYFDAEGDGINVSALLASRGDRETIIAQILSRVRQDLNPFGITVTRWTGRAVEGRGVTTIFAGPSTLSNGSHIACDIDYSNNNMTDIAFVNNEDWGTAADTALALADVFLHEAGHTFGLYHVNTVQDGLLYNESMGLRYSTQDRSRWLADTSFMNHYFDEYLNHGGGRGPQNSYQTMLQNFPSGEGSPAFLGSEPSVTPGSWLEEEQDYHRQGQAVDNQRHGRGANDALDLAIDHLVSENGLRDEPTRGVGWEEVDRPQRGLEKWNSGWTRGGARGLARAPGDAVGAAGFSILDPAAEGRTPSSWVSIIHSDGQDTDSGTFHSMKRRPGRASSLSVRRFI